MLLVPLSTSHTLTLRACAPQLFDLCDGLVAPFVSLKSQPPAATSAFALA